MLAVLLLNFFKNILQRTYFKFYCRQNMSVFKYDFQIVNMNENALKMYSGKFCYIFNCYLIKTRKNFLYLQKEESAEPLF